MKQCKETWPWSGPNVRCQRKAEHEGSHEAKPFYTWNDGEKEMAESERHFLANGPY